MLHLKLKPHVAFHILNKQTREEIIIHGPSDRSIELYFRAPDHYKITRRPRKYRVNDNIRPSDTPSTVPQSN